MATQPNQVGDVFTALGPVQNYGADANTGGYIRVASGGNDYILNPRSNRIMYVIPTGDNAEEQIALQKAAQLTAQIHGGGGSTVGAANYKPITLIQATDTPAETIPDRSANAGVTNSVLQNYIASNPNLTTNDIKNLGVVLNSSSPENTQAWLTQYSAMGAGMLSLSAASAASAISPDYTKIARGGADPLKENYMKYGTTNPTPADVTNYLTTTNKIGDVFTTSGPIQNLGTDANGYVRVTANGNEYLLNPNSNRIVTVNPMTPGYQASLTVTHTTGDTASTPPQAAQAAQGTSALSAPAEQKADAVTGLTPTAAAELLQAPAYSTPKPIQAGAAAGQSAAAVDPVTGLTPDQAAQFAGAYGYVKPTSDDLIAQAVAEQQAKVAAENNASPTEQVVLDEINSTEARDLALAAESSSSVLSFSGTQENISFGKDTSEERDLMLAAASATPLKVTDWRVRLSLAPESNYLYNAVGIKAGDILLPLKATNGVIFPYTPTIGTNYRANYDAVDVTHSNYKLYFYKNSSVDEISLTAEFTAQDTTEANYLLAVIHFFKSVTKMFYGQDGSAAHPGPKAGTPPPLCYLTGYGAYQFDNHPLLISSFQYNLPNEVDYIRAGMPSQSSGQNLSAYNTKTIGYIPSASRLSSAGLNGGGVSNAPNFSNNSLTNNDSTFVPTKMQIVLSMLPIVTRNDISKNFSLQEYATGKLLRGSRRHGGGIW